jgi:ribose/xylose/arabinose/galactoside ABC-type transport system permease subunit
MITKSRRLRFTIAGVLALTTAAAVYAALLSYFRAKHAGVLFAVPLVAMAIVGGVSLMPERHGRWLRPIAVALVCFGSFVLGLWLRKN